MDKKIKEKYNWDNISISKYYDILETLEDESEDVLDKQMTLCSIIEGIDVDILYDLPIEEATERFKLLKFLDDFKLKTFVFSPNNIKLGDKWELTLMKSSQQMNVTQFVDYQNIVCSPDKDTIVKILSIFLIPKGLKYNEGYDILELQTDIKEFLPFITAQSLLNFILSKYVHLLNRSLRYLLLKIMMTKNQKMKEELIVKYKEIKGRMQLLRETVLHICS